MSELLTPDALLHIDSDEIPERMQCAARLEEVADRLAQRIAEDEPDPAERDRAREVAADMWREMAAYACAYWPIQALPDLVERIVTMADQLEQGNDPEL